jgi:tetratricopeptide (TPR) repeat protein
VTYPFADRIVKICLLLPTDKAVIASLLPMAEVAAKSFTVPTDDGESDAFRLSWRSLSLALLEYRRGNYTKAVEWGKRCLAYPEHNAPRAATAEVILAMAYFQLDQVDEARLQLERGRETIEAKFRSGLELGTGVQGFWFDWVFGRILLREATALSEGRKR